MKEHFLNPNTTRSVHQRVFLHSTLSQPAKTNTDTMTNDTEAGCHSQHLTLCAVDSSREKFHNLSFFLRPRPSAVPSDFRFWAYIKRRKYKISKVFRQEQKSHRQTGPVANQYWICRVFFFLNVSRADFRLFIVSKYTSFTERLTRFVISNLVFYFWLGYCEFRKTLSRCCTSIWRLWK